MQEDLQLVRGAAAVGAAVAQTTPTAAQITPTGLQGQRHPRLWLVLVQGEHGIRDGLGQGGLLQRRKVQLQVPEDLRSLHRLALLCSTSATSTLRTGKVAEDKAAAM